MPASPSWMRRSGACSTRSTGSNSGTARWSSSSATTATTTTSATGGTRTRSSSAVAACHSSSPLRAPRAGKCAVRWSSWWTSIPRWRTYCGLKAPHPLAGQSLRPLLADPSRKGRDAAFTLVARGGGQYGQAVRTEGWRYIRWSDGTNELYDETNDPEETHDVSERPAPGRPHSGNARAPQAGRAVPAGSDQRAAKVQAGPQKQLVTRSRASNRNTASL